MSGYRVNFVTLHISHALNWLSSIHQYIEHFLQSNTHTYNDDPEHLFSPDNYIHDQAVPHEPHHAHYQVDHNDSDLCALR